MLTQSAAWRALQAHCTECKTQHLRDLFEADPERARRYRLSCCGVTLDYSKNLIGDKTMRLLVQLAVQQSLPEKIADMFGGVKINCTEQRAVLHTALRSPQCELWLEGENIMPAIHAVLDKMADFVESVRSGRYTGYNGKKIDTVVNIGIGGSDLGPKMVSTALRSHADDRALRVEFVSNVDRAQFAGIAASLNPATSLFIIASKTFTTQETMLNAHAARRWFLDKTGGRGDVSKHFVAVSTAFEETRRFGIDGANVFEFWDWVGGRYSLWSAIGLAIALDLGMDTFRELLAGGHAMDKHFRTAPLPRNMPVLLAMIGIWYNNFFGAQQYLVLPYCYQLKEFPAYIQQLDMESNGKSVDIDGRPVDYATGPAVWGGLGSNAQHAFYQLLHQGTHFIPADFIASTSRSGSDQEVALAANYIGQTQALMRGRTEREVVVDSEVDDDPDLLPHKLFPGNRPSNAIVMQSLDARTLGALIALYEHKVFVQGVIWRVNSFDQWGVELGKQLARDLEPALAGRGDVTELDTSTQGLVELLKG